MSDLPNLAGALLSRDRSGYLTDRYSERRRAADKLEARLKLGSVR